MLVRSIMPSFSMFFARDNSINETQKNIIQALFDFWLDEIYKLQKDNAIKALKAISQDSISNQDIEFLERIKIWDIVKQIRQIYTHPAPQNRSEDNPYLHLHPNRFMVVYKDAQGNYAFEQRGLLSLSARNDNTAPPINKESTIKYIQFLLDDAIKEVANHYYIGPDKKIRSYIRRETMISVKDWVICIARNLKTNKTSIYIEGIKASGFIFSYEYLVTKNQIGLIYLKTRNVKRSEFVAEQKQLQIFEISNAQGEKLIQKVREEALNLMNGVSISFRGSSNSSLGQCDDYTTEWAIKKLSQINIIVDENQFTTMPQRFSCSIM
jgi:hypothetical protein